MRSPKPVFLILALAAFLAAGAVYLGRQDAAALRLVRHDDGPFCYLSQRRLTPCPEGR